jgi:hypothetical protein
MKCTAYIVGLGLLSLGAPAQAHHSFAMFDRAVNLTLEGTVTEFEFTNRHSWLYVVTIAAEGQEAEWTIEMGGPNAMSRSGWQADTLKPGDEITVEIHPLKDGTYGGQYVLATLPDGTTIAGGDASIPGRAR